MNRARTIFFVLLIMITGRSMAQFEADIWYFGENAGLDFNSTPPVPLTDGQLNQIEGCASIADNNGNLLLYTDGITIWNKNHQAMPNGTDMLGDVSATQSGIVVPRPGSDHEVYVFTVDNYGETDGLCYSLVDLDLDGGLGDVVPGMKNIQLQTPVAEKVTAALHANGDDFWVISHGFENNTFYSYYVSAAGVNVAPVISSVGPIHAMPESGSSGALKASVQGDKLALAVAIPHNRFEIYDFNNTTGAVSNPVVISNFYYAYGVEFSPDGNLLYGSCAGIGAGKIPTLWQFDLNAGNIAASAVNVGTSTAYLGQLQLSPQGKIYGARYNEPALAVVENPNTPGVGCNFVEAGQFLGGKNSKLGLPNYWQVIIPEVEFQWTQTCFGDATQFTGQIAKVPDSVIWDFDDPASGAANSAATLNAQHVFTAPGTYEVKLTAYFGSDSSYNSHSVEIAPVVSIDLGADLMGCAGSEFDLTSGTGYAGYLWSDGSVDDTLTVNSTGTYWVEVSNVQGCSDRDTIDVVISDAINPDAGPDQSIPFGSTTGLNVTTGSPGVYNYQWQPAALLNDATMASPATVALTSSTWFYVEVTNQTTLCNEVDSVYVEVTGSVLNLTVSADNMALCYGDDVQLNALVTGGTGVYSYAWTSNPVGFISDLEGPLATPLTTTKYYVLVTDGFQVKEDSITVQVYPEIMVNITAPASIPNGTSTTLQSNVQNLTGTAQYQWEPAALLNDATVASPQTTILTGATTFTLLVTDAATGCTGTTTVMVDVTGDPLSVVATAADNALCYGESTQLSAVAQGGSGSYSYSWVSLPAGFTSTLANPVITPVVTTEYFVTADDGFTTVQASVMVTAYPEIMVDITAPASIPNGTSTTLQSNVQNLTGTAQYQWEPAALLNDATVASPQTTILTGATTFTLLVTDAATGCTGTTTVMVDVTGDPLSVVATAVDNALCYGESTQLSAVAQGGSGSYSYSWVSQPAGFTSTLANPVITPVVTTEYFVTADDGFTTVQASVMVTAYPEIMVDITAPASIPNGTSTTLQSNVQNLTGTAQYQWEPAALLNDATVASPQTTILTGATTFTLLVTDAATGCTGTSTVMVDVTGDPLSVVATAADNALCYGESTQLSAVAQGGSGSYSYSWVSQPAGFTSTLANPVITPVVTTEYFVTADDGFTTVQAPVTVVVNALPEVVVEGEQEILFGTSTELSAIVSGSDGPFSYQWTPAELLHSTPDQPVVQTTLLQQSVTFTVMVTDETTQCAAQIDFPVMVTGDPLTIQATATPEIVCAGQEVILQALCSGGSENYTYQWSSEPVGFNATGAEVMVTPEVNTIYTVVGDDGFNQVTTQVTVQVNPLPIVDAGAQQSIYVGEYTTLQGVVLGTSQYTVQWSPENRVMTPDALQTETVPLADDTWFYLSVVDANTQCVGVDSVEVLMMGAPLSVAVTAQPAQICEGDPVVLQGVATGGTGNYSYSWSSTPAGFVSDMAFPVDIPESTTTYFVTVYDGENSVQGQVTVTVFPAVEAMAGDDQYVLIDSTAWLSVIPPVNTEDYTVQWEPATMVEDPAAWTTTTVAMQTETAFTVTITNSVTGCYDEDEVVVGVMPAPLALFLPADHVVCYGDAIEINPQIIGGSGNYEYFWEAVTTGFTATSPSVIVSPEATAIYSLLVIDKVTLDQVSASTNIEVIIMPELVLEEEVTLKYGSHVEINSGLEGVTFLWSTGSTMSAIEVSEPGIYSLEVSDKGCTVSDQVRVVYDESSQIDVPSAFSPNGDGINDYFGVMSYGVLNGEFSVFNRFGQLVFHSENLNQRWDGTRNGAELASEVYVYVVEGTYFTGEPFSLNGTVTLLK